MLTSLRPPLPRLVRRPSIRLGVLAATIAAVAACSDAAAPTVKSSLGNQQAKDSSSGGKDTIPRDSVPRDSVPFDSIGRDTTPKGVLLIRGTVLGYTPPPDSSYRPLANVTITVWRVVRDTTAKDSATATTTLVKQGTIVSDKSGDFAIANIPAGYYYLDAVPPATSGFRPGRAGSVSYAASSGGRSLIYLYK